MFEEAGIIGVGGVDMASYDQHREAVGIKMPLLCLRLADVAVCLCVPARGVFVGADPLRVRRQDGRERERRREKERNGGLCNVAACWGPKD